VGIVLGVLIAAALGVIYVVSLAPPRDRLTEFYLLGPDGTASGYPTRLTRGQSGTVIIGITNHEHEAVVYTVEVVLANVTLDILNAIFLEHEATFEQRYTFTPRAAAEQQLLEFQLFKNYDPQVYRELHFWITVQPP
jgi:uncharacterized membrane protein